MATNHKNYTDIFNVKDIYVNKIAPKYFKVEDTNQLNVGLFGQINESISTTTEDVYSTITAYTDELIPGRARLPESIYGYATTVQLEDLFARPAEIQAVIYVNVSDINKPANRKKDYYEFFLDKNAQIFVDDILFMLDYDIRVQSIPYRDTFIYNVIYSIDHDNYISDIKNPYIKSTVIGHFGNSYLAMLVKLHQVERFVYEENIVNNTVLNMPIIPVSFEGKKLCGFNVFYKNNLTDKEVQLELRLLNTPPIKKPFCYYRLKDDNTFEISFTTRDYYFKPEINSNLTIEYFTTNGEDGNFPKYTGDNINVIPKSDRWDYNNNLLVFATVQTGSAFGSDMPTLDTIKARYIEKMTTIDSYTTDDDLQIHFDNFNKDNKATVKFIKTRDDFQRIYTAYILLRDKYGDLYHTNTLSTVIHKDNFDTTDDNKLLLIKPGRLFTYTSGSVSHADMHSTKRITDDYSDINEKFIYSNPFLIAINKSPNSVAYYLNSIDKTVITDYTYINDKSIVQFICNSFDIKRYALTGESKYTISTRLSSTIELEEDIFDNATKEDKGVLKAILTLLDESNEPISFKEFTIKSYNKTKRFIDLELTVTTDDYMNIKRRFKLLDTKDYKTGIEEAKYIPMIASDVSISVFYKLADNLSHNINIDSVRDLTLTNIYTTVDTKIDWISPLLIMHSDFTFLPLSDNNWNVNLHAIPLIKADEVKDITKKKELLDNLDRYVRFTNKAVSKITNNYSVDLKFFNSYGKSRVMTIGEERSNLLDRVNLELKMRLRPRPDTPVADLLRDVKIHIKNFLEEINTSVFNRFHISNLIQSLENSFPDIDYLQFLSINEYDSLQQSLVSKYEVIESLGKQERRDFVPEFINIGLDDIHISLLTD